MPLTAAEIAARWGRCAGRLDPTTGDSIAQALLCPPDERNNVLRALSYLNIVREKQPGLFRDRDLDWAFDPAAHPRGIDAALHVRLSWQLAGLHESGSHHPVMERLITRHTFAFRSTSAPPRLVQEGDLYFIVIPFAFLELAQLLLRAFETWIVNGQCDGDAWAALDSANSPPTNAIEAPAAFRQALARWLTNDRFHPGLSGEEPTSVLRARSRWFSESRELPDLAPATEFVAQLDYSLTDFALAHEAGHAIAGHTGVRALQAELEADALALALFEAARSWRDEILDPCPLGGHARLALGPMVFASFDLWRLSLWRGARARFDRGPRADGAAFEANMSECERRGEAITHHLDRYTGWARDHELISETDLDQLRRLQRRLSAFGCAIAAWCAAPSDDDVGAVHSLMV